MNQLKLFIKKVNNKRIYKEIVQLIITNNSKIMKAFTTKSFNTQKSVIKITKMIPNMLNYQKGFTKKNNYRQ